MSKKDDLIVIHADGGICSQILYLAMGRWICEHCGFRVKYDLVWYREYGRDNDGIQARNWDIPRAFSDLMVEEASIDEITYCKTIKQISLDQVTEFSAPCYITGGSLRWNAWKEYCAFFAMHLIKVKQLRNTADQQLCAVHVRRGDLSKYNPAYGFPPSPRYYKLAVDFIRSQAKDVLFLFFSDDHQYVRDVLIPQLGEDDLKVMADNGSNLGYLDLAAIAECDYVIGSHGSLGRFGAQMSLCNRLTILPEHRFSVDAAEKLEVYTEIKKIGIPTVESVLSARRANNRIDTNVYHKYGIYRPMYHLLRHLQKHLANNQ